MVKSIYITTLVGLLLFAPLLNAKDIVHDAEHYILLEQHGKQWAAEDKQIDAKLAEIQKQNGGKRPNIFYILVDDVGFGEMGSEQLNHVRGYRTPNINKLATESMSFSRMYTEPSCTPTRTAFLTGRIPVRSHMLEPKVVPPEGVGLNAKEVTIAEVLKKAGYNTAHVGKWHQGDIKEAMPHNQGFDTAVFPLHNQATFNLMTPEAEIEHWAFNVAPRETDPNYRLDANFRPTGWVLGVEAKKGGQAREWGVKAGDPANYSYSYFKKLNNRYKVQVIETLQRLAKEDEPFFLNYWPQIPVDFGRIGKEFKTANGGSWVESMAELDTHLGDVFEEIKRLGIADNTVIVVMGDNGPMKQARPESGFSDMIYRGYKAESLEGGIRVNAFLRWPTAVKAGSVVGDIIHISDLYTTFANIAGAKKYIPRDRIVDGVDQSALLLMGEGKSRRDYFHVYEGPNLAATIKEQYKVHWPPPGQAAFKLPVYDLYRDPRERYPLKIQAMWSVAYFAAMKDRHMAFKKKYPDRPETKGAPYGGIENLRPESKALLKTYYTAQKLAK